MRSFLMIYPQRLFARNAAATFLRGEFCPRERHSEGLHGQTSHNFLVFWLKYHDVTREPVNTTINRVGVLSITSQVFCFAGRFHHYQYAFDSVCPRWHELVRDRPVWLLPTHSCRRLLVKRQSPSTLSLLAFERLAISKFPR